MALAGFLLFQVQPLLAKYILPWFGGSAADLAGVPAVLPGGAAGGLCIRLRASPCPSRCRGRSQLQLALLVVSLVLLPITPSDGLEAAGCGRSDAAHPGAARRERRRALRGARRHHAAAVALACAHRARRSIRRAFSPPPTSARSPACSPIPSPSSAGCRARRRRAGGRGPTSLYAMLLLACGLLTLARAKGEPTSASTPARGPVAASRFAGAMDRPFRARLGPAARHDQRHHAMVGRRAVPVDRAAQPLSAHLRHRLRGIRRLYHRVAVRQWRFLLLAGIGVDARRCRRPRADFLVQLALQSATLFAGCMICHGELVRLQPAPERLPEFYLAIAAGGALGGVLVTLAAPLALHRLLRASRWCCACDRRPRRHARAARGAHGCAGSRSPRRLAGSTSS